MFHGPPDSPLHHNTAFVESDSMIILNFFISLLDSEIAIARCIAKTSAQFISMYGMGEENKHMKFPRWFRKTPPIAEHDSTVCTEASTFHFRHLVSGGCQISGGIW